MSGSSPAYFENKRGEVNELRGLLRSVNTGRDNKKKRDVVKKVIAYMTLGIDVSRLFSDMVLASNTKDMVIKKMVYLFLSTYARRNPDLTLLVINTLQKDCRDEDPMIRGLALRSLCSLRIPSIIEYVVTPLRSALDDMSPYVRKTGVMGIPKVYAIAPEVVRDSDLVDVLYNMLRDRDLSVVVNCILALNELMVDEGGIAINQAIVHHLLRQIRHFSDWGQCTVMDLVARYEPESEDELFGIMDLLDPCLRVANSAVVLSTAKCFLSLTKSMPEVQAQVYERLRTPMLTLVSTPAPEIAFSVLSHVRHMIDRAPGVFDTEYKQFFCRYNEPTHVKHLKMDILPQIANESNAAEIVSELTEYVSGVDANMARQAIRSIGEIAIRLPMGAEGVIESLTELLGMDMDWVRSETVVVMRDLLRKYPDRAELVMPSLQRCLRRMDDPAGRAAVVWMIGEFGHLIDDAPYLLEPLIDGIADEPNVEVQLELLTASMKLFFKRPPEMRMMLGRLFKACLDEGVDVAVHDRALLYFRLLRCDVKEANAVIAGPQGPIDNFLPEMSDEVKARIFDEFNSLSMVYNKPAEDFISPEYLFEMRRKKAQEDEGGDVFGGDTDAAGRSAEPAPAGAGAGGDTDFFSEPLPQPAPSSGPQHDETDLLGDFGGAPAPAQASSGAQTLSFVPDASMDAREFQQRWKALSPAEDTSIPLQRSPEAGEVEQACRSINVLPLASGSSAATLKFFFFAVEAPAPQQVPGTRHLVQLLVHTDQRRAQLTIKCERDSVGSACLATIRRAFESSGWI